MTMAERIDADLKAYICRAEMPEGLRDAMAYSLFAGGKRLRSMLCLSACELAGGDMGAAMPVACALEMIHTYSLIHDDLPCMDDDDFRRGRLSSHKVFGEANALLAGDGLLTYAFEVMLSEGVRHAGNAPRYFEAAAVVAQGAGVGGMVAGQWEDIANEKNPRADAETLVHIHSRKTGALIKASVLAGGLIGGADEWGLASLSDFGMHFGLLFQITDDLLDVEGDTETVGKTLRKDAAQQKLTYPALYGAGQARKMAHQEAERAKAALSSYGDRAQWFLDLVKQTLVRTF